MVTCNADEESLRVCLRAFAFLCEKPNIINESIYQWFPRAYFVMVFCFVLCIARIYWQIYDEGIKTECVH